MPINKGAEKNIITGVVSFAKKKVLQSKQNIVDLSAEGLTGGFSGADLEGLVRCAGSIALSRARQQGHGIDGILITLDDVAQALKEIKF